MHTDDEGIEHPLMLAAETESADVHFTSCSTCGSRWAGPFKTGAMAARVADLANASAYYELPARIRPPGAGLCHGPDGLPIGTPGAMIADAPVPQHVQLGQAAGDLGKALVLTGYGLFTAVRMIVLLGIRAARFLIKLGMWGAVVVGALALAAYLGAQKVSPYVPDPATSAQALLGVLGILAALGVVAVLARGLRGGLAEPQAAPVENLTRTDYSTPLTTARGASSVSSVSKTPADELPKG